MANQNQNENRELAIKLTNVKKMYKLGQIGGGTLQADLQSWWARVRGKEDPNTRIGTNQRLVGKTFMALNGIDLTVYRGEALGIIGSNGAGKSTMLKLLSRVTAPTSGKIQIWGRIASMLEVGTGFHGEMTGRENVYLNGAILGMTKAEIDAKMEDIIEFSEVREFIDTPVKRYSSGMYVKLAFSVAAHLDSEIMIMDEVLAVGDMAFQKKCLDKMRNAAKKEGRTVLYVSHNMNTIRQLCDRCVVLDKGKLAFQGDVDRAIAMYLKNDSLEKSVDIDLSSVEHYGRECTQDVVIEHLELKNKSVAIYNEYEALEMCFLIDVKQLCKNVALRMTISNMQGGAIGSVWSDTFDCLEYGKMLVNIVFPLKMIPKGEYVLAVGFHIIKSDGRFIPLDFVENAFKIEIEQKVIENNIIWSTDHWGSIRFPDCQVVEKRSV